jgi:hypothetical protein
MTDAYSPPSRESLLRWHAILEGIEAPDEDVALVARDLATRLRLLPSEQWVKFEDNAWIQHQQKMTLALRRLSRSSALDFADTLRDLVVMDPQCTLVYEGVDIDTLFPGLGMVGDIFVRHVAGPYLHPCDLLNLERTSKGLPSAPFMKEAWVAVGRNRFRHVAAGFAALLQLQNEVPVRNLVLWCNFLLQYLARTLSIRSLYPVSPDDFLPDHADLMAIEEDARYRCFGVRSVETHRVFSLFVQTVPMNVGSSGAAPVEIFGMLDRVLPGSSDPSSWFKAFGRQRLFGVLLKPFGSGDPNPTVSWSSTRKRLESENPYFMIMQPSAAVYTGLTADELLAFHEWEATGVPMTYDVPFVPVPAPSDPEDLPQPEPLFRVRFTFGADKRVSATLGSVDWLAVMRVHVKRGVALTPPLEDPDGGLGQLATLTWSRGAAAWDQVGPILRALSHIRNRWIGKILLSGRLLGNQHRSGGKKDLQIVDVCKHLLFPLMRVMCGGDASAPSPALAGLLAQRHPYSLIPEFLPLDPKDGQKMKARRSCTYEDKRTYLD